MYNDNKNITKLLINTIQIKFKCNTKIKKIKIKKLKKYATGPKTKWRREAATFTQPVEEIDTGVVYLKADSKDGRVPTGTNNKDRGISKPQGPGKEIQ